jgi:serine/threonine-protein kinase
LFNAGQSIGNYRVLAKIGTGGMGAVYLCEHPLIGKKVALKVIHRELSGNREVVQRFFQEARSVNKIGNEHIVEIHDFGVTDNGDHFYIMEYLEGHTLATVLGREKVLAVMRALHIGSQIANALAATHAAGIIHRDLKPDNIMLTLRLGDPDFVKVLDFGLAKVLAGGGNAVVKTAAGVLLGTPQYMSPEACESKRELDHRTDIYALGVLLFQMMTGSLPFDGESMGEVLVKQVTALPPAPRGINPQIPPSVEQVLLRCLAKQPDARFPTMIALRDALLDPEAYLRNSPPISPARSVAPGEAKVDAKTVVAHAAAMQKTRIGTASHALPLPPQPTGAYTAATVIAEGVPPARKPTAAPFLAPAEPNNNTMRIATPMGYSSRPPRKMWPVVLVVGLIAGLVGGGLAASQCGADKKSSDGVAKADGSDGTRGTDSKPGSDSKPSSDASGSNGPGSDAPGNNTTPGSHAPGSGSDPTGANTPGSNAPAPADAGVVIDASPMFASIVIESAPLGAEVYGPDHKLLGKTPVHLELPVDPKPVTFELRAPGYKRRTKQLVIGGNVAMRLELERLPVIQVPRPPPTGSGSNRPPPGRGSNHDNTGLMKPDD